MSRKIQYRAVSIEQANPEVLANALTGASKLVVAIDVAKAKMMAGFGREDGAVVRLVRWTSPSETRAFVELVTQTARKLVVPIEALMEPTGTYGEPLRALLLANHVHVFMLSPKRVHGRGRGLRWRAQHARRQGLCRHRETPPAERQQTLQ